MNYAFVPGVHSIRERVSFYCNISKTPLKHDGIRNILMQFIIIIIIIIIINLDVVVVVG